MHIPSSQARPASSEKAIGFSSYYLLGLLFLTNVLNYVDRQIPFILAEPIKHDLGLSDTELGLLGGMIFTIIYSTGGLFFARLSDRTSPGYIVSFCLALWSLATATAGFAQNLWHLAASRIFVAAGESGMTPAAHSLVARRFPSRVRGTVIAVLSMGVPIGFTLGMWLGGWIGETMDWRYAFFILGAPGLLVSLALALATRKGDAQEEPRPPARPLREGLTQLIGNPTYRHLLLGMAFYGFAQHTMVVFMPTFFVRSHGLSVGQVGLWLGLIYAVFGTLGTYLGGLLSDRLGRWDDRWRLLLPAAALALGAPFFLAVLLVGDARLAILLFIVPKFCSLLFFAPAFRVVQDLAPLQERAMTTAIALLAMSIGNSIGPLLVGLSSDALAPVSGAGSLGEALSIVTLALLASAYFFFRASRQAAAG